jgi:hypothetical protein
MFLFMMLMKRSPMHRIEVQFPEYWRGISTGTRMKYIYLLVSLSVLVEREG